MNKETVEIARFEADMDAIQKHFQGVILNTTARWDKSKGHLVVEAVILKTPKEPKEIKVIKLIPNVDINQTQKL